MKAISFVIIVLCFTWFIFYSQAQVSTVKNICTDEGCQNPDDKYDLIDDERVIRTTDEETVSNENPNIRIDNLIEDLVEFGQSVHQSTRDQSNDFDNIATLQVNNEKRIFVPLVNVSVESWIHLFAADVTLTQTFINLEEKPIEAIYVFPIEENAAIYSMTAEIDDRLITAQIKEKQIAENEYKEAIQHGQTATLLRQSQNKLDVFTINVGAIPPGKECRIIIRYITELDLLNKNSIRFVIPTTVAPRYDPTLECVQSPDQTDSKYVQNTPYSISFKVHVQRDGIWKVSNRSHSINFTKSSELITLSTEDVALDRDYIIDILLSRNQPSILNVVEQFDSNKYAILTALIPHDIFQTDYVTSEFIFIVDCSGSMMGENKIGLAREAMLLFIRSLPVGSYFNIIRFGSNYQIQFDNEVSVIYNEETAKQAERLSQIMQADLGGTELWQPLNYLKNNPPAKERSRQVFLLTDGEVSNTDKVIELCRSMSSNTRIFTFGLGYSPSRSLVKGVARATNGYFEFVPPGQNVDTYVGSQLRRSLKPSIVNAHLDWYGLPTDITQCPDVIPPLYSNERTIIYTLFESNELDKHMIHIDFRTRGKIIDSATFNLHDVYRKGDGIRRLAAKAMIQKLQHTTESNDNNGNIDFIKQRITLLSINHQIISPYTAFVGVETTRTKIDNSIPSQVRHVSIQISKDDEHLFSNMYFAATRSSSAFMNFLSISDMAFYSLIGGSLDDVQTTIPVAPALTVYNSTLIPTSKMLKLNETEETIKTAKRDQMLDQVRWLINKQSFNGAWLLTDNDVQELTRGSSISMFESKLTRIEDVITTAIVIAVLETNHSDQQNLWNALVDKGRRYIINSGLTEDETDQLIFEIKNKLSKG